MLEGGCGSRANSVPSYLRDPGAWDVPTRVGCGGHWHRAARGYPVPPPEMVFGKNVCTAGRAVRAAHLTTVIKGVTGCGKDPGEEVAR